MNRKEFEEIVWLEFDLLRDCPGVQHGVFLRHGGRSQGPFAALNVSLSVGDNQSDVLKNRRKIVEVFSLPETKARLHTVTQCHGKGIYQVSDIVASVPPACDALVTDKLHEALMTQHADCQTAIIYDPVHHAAANVHSGWKGSVLNIYAEAIRTMRGLYQSRPRELLACIGPSLGPEAAEFVNYAEELPPSFWEFQVKPNYFDFWAISRTQLEACGVLSHHIEIAELCTYKNPRDFYSYRREKITGRHATVVVLRERKK